MARSPSTAMNLRRAWVLGVIFLVTGCPDKTKIDASDLNEVQRVFRTGIDHPTDPFVRAETLRILTSLHDPQLLEFAKSAKDDPSPMVRVAALRAMLATGDSEVRQIALNSFSRAKRDEQLQILNAVLEFGSAPLKREVTARALRGKDPTLRRIAFESGMLARVDKAIADGKTKYLERAIYPELARYVDRNDATIGALALGKFVEIGQAERAEPLIRVFNREDMKLEERIKAARTLSGAHVAEAESHFMKIVDEFDKSVKDESLGIPGKIIPQDLLRAAVIGAAAAGNQTIVPRAKVYMKNASLDQTLEMLDALATNASPDAALALKVAMQDAREEVRGRAIELYERREDADPNALVKAMYGTSYATQRRLASVLMVRYLETWIDAIRIRLKRQSDVQPTLRMLRDVLLTKEEVQRVVGPIRDRLQEIMSAETDQRAALAAYLLAVAAESSSEAEMAALDRRLDDSTRYAFLEFQMRERHESSVKLFRAYINADLFAMRLVSAAGLWRLRTPDLAEAPNDSETESTPEPQKSDD